MKESVGTESNMNEKKSEITTKDTSDPVKKAERKDQILEVVIAIGLGIAAFLTAWATWIGSLHAGLQATHFTESNNLSSKTSAMYIQSSELLLKDIMTWNSIQNYVFDAELAQEQGDTRKVELLQKKVMALREGCTDEFNEALQWALENEKSPFEEEGFAESYFTDAIEGVEAANAKLAEGKQDNQNSDTYGLVTVIYSIVLFLLGIAAIFKHFPNRVAVVAIAIGFLVLDTIFMLTIPMPKGFSLSNYL